MAGRGQPTKRPTKQVLKELILKYYDREIGEQFGVDRVTVQNWKKHYGLGRGK